MVDIERFSTLELLNLHAKVLDELRARSVIRSSNNPVGDYAEYLFCRAFGWQQAGNSEKDADAIGEDDTRYQIKGRRLTQHNASRQLSAIRRLPEKNFDYVAAVLFNENFSILRAALIPHAQVVENANYVEATHSWRFLLRDEIWNLPTVKDVTTELVNAVS